MHARRHQWQTQTSRSFFNGATIGCVALVFLSLFSLLLLLDFGYGNQNENTGNQKCVDIANASKWTWDCCGSTAQHCAFIILAKDKTYASICFDKRSIRTDSKCNTINGNIFRFVKRAPQTQKSLNIETENGMPLYAFLSAFVYIKDGNVWKMHLMWCLFFSC